MKRILLAMHKSNEDVTHRQPFCLRIFDNRYSVLGCANNFIMINGNPLVGILRL